MWEGESWARDVDMNHQCYIVSCRTTKTRLFTVYIMQTYCTEGIKKVNSPVLWIAKKIDLRCQSFTAWQGPVAHLADLAKNHIWQRGAAQLCIALQQETLFNMNIEHHPSLLRRRTLGLYNII